MSRSDGEYAGPHTELKVERVGQICAMFLEDMQDTPFKTIYVEACSGSGVVKLRGGKKRKGGFDIPLPEPYIEGSPMQVLRLKQRFSEYHFVDKSQECCRKLRKVITLEFPKRKKRTKVACKDVNKFLLKFCRSTKWRKRRAVIFVDPFRPIVPWKTIKAIAETKAADLIFMLPAGVSLARMLKRDGNVSDNAKQVLRRLFGTDDWHDTFYSMYQPHGFFPGEPEKRRQQGCEAIIKYFVERLATLFPHVAPNQQRIQNKTGLTMYALCFASHSKERTEAVTKLFRSARLAAGLGLPRVNEWGKREAKRSAPKKQTNRKRKP